LKQKLYIGVFMKPIKIAFFETKSYDRMIFDKINQKYQYQIDYFDHHLTYESLPLVVDHEVVCGFVNDHFDVTMINMLSEKNVKLIALRCAGYNNVDLTAAKGKIPVVRVPRYSPYAVAEYAVGLMLSLNRKIHRAYSRTRDNNFSIEGFLGFDMHKKCIGIIGTGGIGQIVAKILQGFGMNILLYDPYPNEAFAKSVGAKYVDLDTLYNQSNIISLHCPLTPETHYLIDQKSIEKMKDGVMIINTGRGALINTVQLIQAIKSKKVGSAGLDVYEEESEFYYEDLSHSFISDDTLARLQTFPNVLITSHQGFFTQEAIQDIAETTLENIRQYLECNNLINDCRSN
jgi:D-lactate dehydrogenase